MGIYGYTRASTKGQKVDRQITSMLKQGIKKENIFIDKASGKNFNRKEYNKLLSVLKSRDVLYIDEIDRLGRNYDEIKKQWNNFSLSKIYIKVIKYPILDTDKTNSSLIDRFLKDIVFLVLAFQAEQEYIGSKRKQAEGIASAKEKGLKFGRPKKKISPEIIEIMTNWSNGLISPNEAMRELKIKKSSFYRLASQLFKNDD